MGYQRAILAIAGVTCAVACAPHVESISLAEGHNTVRDDVCAFSFECANGDVCDDDGVCVPGPSSLEEAYLFEPNPDRAYLEPRTPVGLFGDASDQSVSPPGDDSLTAEDLAAALLAGMDQVGTGPSSFAILAANPEYRDLSFTPAAAGPVREAMEQAWADHVALREAMIGDGVLEIVQDFGELHREKNALRDDARRIEAYLSDLQLGTETGLGGCEYFADYVLHPMWAEAVLDPAVAQRAFSVQSIVPQATPGFISCVDTLALTVDALERMDLRDEEGTAMVPIASLRETLAAIRDQYLAGPLSTEAHRAAFYDGSSYIRARELTYAVSLYASYALRTARTVSNLFPFTELELGSMGDRAFGELAAGVSGVEQARALLGEALLEQNRYLVALATNPPDQAAELLQIGLLSENFLADHPEFQGVAAALSRELAQAQSLSLIEGLAAGAGCAGGTYALTFVTGPWGLLLAGATGIVCALDFYLQHQAYRETQHLLQQAMMFRYFGVGSTLASLDQVRSLRFSLGVQRVALVVSVLGLVASGAKVLTSFRAGLQALKVSRGVRGFFSWVDLESMPAIIARRFPTALPEFADPQRFIRVIRGGGFWPYHNLGHTNGVVNHTVALLDALHARGLIPFGDVELGRIAAWFHDYVQIIDEVDDTGFRMGVSRVFQTGEDLSADAAARWMRAQGRFSDLDIARVQRAIRDATPVMPHDDFVLAPAGFVRDPDAFFVALDGAGPDYLPLALAMGDFGAHNLDDAAAVLGETGKLFLEENPGVARAFLQQMPDGTYVYRPTAEGLTHADETAAAMRGYISFVPNLAEGRRLFATESWLARVPNPNDLAGVIHQVYPGLSSSALVDTLRASAATAQTQSLQELLLGLHVVGP